MTKMGINGVPHDEGEKIVKPGVFPRDHPDDDSTLPPEPPEPPPDKK